MANPFDVDIDTDMDSEYTGLFVEGLCVAFSKNTDALFKFKFLHYPNHSYMITPLHCDHDYGVTEIAPLPSSQGIPTTCLKTPE